MTAFLDALIYLQNISFDRHDRFKAGTDLEQQKERNKSGLNSFKTGFFRYASPFKTAKKIALDCLTSQQSRGYPSLLISNIFSCTSLSLFGGTILCSPNLRLSLYKHRSAMNLPTEAACLSGVMSSSGARAFLPACIQGRECLGHWNHLFLFALIE